MQHVIRKNYVESDGSKINQIHQIVDVRLRQRGWNRIYRKTESEHNFKFYNVKTMMQRQTSVSQTGICLSHNEFTTRQLSTELTGQNPVKHVGASRNSKRPAIIYYPFHTRLNI